MLIDADKIDEVGLDDEQELKEAPGLTSLFSRFIKAVVLLVFLVVVAMLIAKLLAVTYLSAKAVDWITQTFGLPPMMKPAIALLAFGACWRIANDLFSFRSNRRSKAYSVLVASFMAVSILAWTQVRDDNFERDGSGKALRFCAMTPTGLYCRNEPGVDPEFSEPLKPVTKEMAHWIHLLKNRTQMRVDESQSDWFHPATGQPLLWYCECGDGTEFYALPGYHPVEQTQLKPVSNEVALRYKSQRQSGSPKVP